MRPDHRDNLASHSDEAFEEAHHFFPSWKFFAKSATIAAFIPNLAQAFAEHF